jgi:hypothetical protein
LLDAAAREVDRTAKPSELLNPAGEADLLVRVNQFVILTVGLALDHDVNAGDSSTRCDWVYSTAVLS